MDRKEIETDVETGAKAIGTFAVDFPLVTAFIAGVIVGVLLHWLF